MNVCVYGDRVRKKEKSRVTYIVQNKLWRLLTQHWHLEGDCQLSLSVEDEHTHKHKHTGRELDRKKERESQRQIIDTDMKMHQIKPQKQVRKKLNMHRLCQIKSSYMESGRKEGEEYCFPEWFHRLEGLKRDLSSETRLAAVDRWAGTDTTITLFQNRDKPFWLSNTQVIVFQRYFISFVHKSDLVFFHSCPEGLDYCSRGLRSQLLWWRVLLPSQCSHERHQPRHRTDTGETGIYHTDL